MRRRTRRVVRRATRRVTRRAFLRATGRAATAAATGTAGVTATTVGPGSAAGRTTTAVWALAKCAARESAAMAKDLITRFMVMGV